MNMLDSQSMLPNLDQIFIHKLVTQKSVNSIYHYVKEVEISSLKGGLRT